MMRFGRSPRAWPPICVDGWKKWSRSHAFKSFVRSAMVCSSDAERDASGDVEAEVFELGEGFDAVARALAPEPRLLDAAERDRRAGQLDPVHGDHAVFELAAEPQDARG